MRCIVSHNRTVAYVTLVGGRVLKHPVDVHVGHRIRRRRLANGVSQEALGNVLELTFQQIQKYEKGANRVGASRLYTIAKILDVPVQYFFDEMPTELIDELPVSEKFPDNTVGTGYVMKFVASREGLALNTAFSKIKSPETRKAFVDFVKTLT